MFVDNGAAQVPAKNIASVAHGGGQGDAFVDFHAVEIDRHREGRRLGVGNFAVYQPAHQELQLGCVQHFAIAFLADNFLR